MAIRYCGDLKVRIEYVGTSPDNRESYRGVISCPGYSWTFSDLRSGMGAHASDSPEAYDEMARSAISFATYYTTDNRDPDDDPGPGFPTAEQSDAFDEAAWHFDDGGRIVTRSKRR